MFLTNVPAIVKAFTTPETTFDIAINYDKATVLMAHAQFEADIQITTGPAGVTVTAHTADTIPFDLFSSTYNNFVPHNLVAIHFHE